MEVLEKLQMYVKPMINFNPEVLNRCDAKYEDVLNVISFVDAVEKMKKFCKDLEILYQDRR